LQALLADPTRTKIFHYARFDVALLFHTFGVMTAPVFCTKIASRLTRTYTDQHGLKSITKELLGVDLSKQQQSSDWGAETLSQAQQAYAASDVCTCMRSKPSLRTCSTVKSAASWPRPPSATFPHAPNLTCWVGVTAISSPTRERVQRPPAGPMRSPLRGATRRECARLRFLVPAAGALSVVIVLAGWWYSTATIPDLAITDVTLTEEGIAMDAPVLRGEDDEGRPYELRAQEAFQSLSVNPVITMRMLEGELTIDDDEQAFIRAPQARFDSETQIMAFEEGGVELRLSSGGEAFLGSARSILKTAHCARRNRCASPMTR
jgi:hypothetical protein